MLQFEKNLPLKCVKVHNAFLPMGYFVQVVMWGDSDETCPKCKTGMSSVN